MTDKPERFSDPDFEPTDQQWRELAEKALLVTRWRDAMADQGVKVLALGLSPHEENRRAKNWHEKQQNIPG